MFIRFLVKKLVTVIVFLVVVGIIGYLYISSGFYNVAASDHHNSLTLWAISTTTDNSVRHHSDDIVVPNDVMADSLAGFEHYNEMCLDCHGGPGIGREEYAEGMYPLPPTLVGIDSVWTQPQLFWIIKNGFKFTGMPEFGSTHSDEQIWKIVAFADHLSHMSYRDYMAMQDSLGGEDMDEHDESGD